MVGAGEARRPGADEENIDVQGFTFRCWSWQVKFSMQVRPGPRLFGASRSRKSLTSMSRVRSTAISRSRPSGWGAALAPPRRFRSCGQLGAADPFHERQEHALRMPEETGEVVAAGRPARSRRSTRESGTTTTRSANQESAMSR